MGYSMTESTEAIIEAVAEAMYLTTWSTIGEIKRTQALTIEDCRTLAVVAIAAWRAAHTSPPEFNHAEIAFIFDRVNGRVLEAMNAGEDPAAGTAVWRRAVWEKLLDWRDGAAHAEGARSHEATRGGERD